MKKTNITYWLLNVIGALAVFSSIYAYTEGAEFNHYFWGGLCGLVLIGTSKNVSDPD